MKIFLAIAVLFCIITMGACKKEGTHSVRIANNYQYQLIDVKIGSTAFGSVTPGAKTGYLKVEDGKQQVTGVAQNATLNGYTDFKGKGKNKWTLLINANGSYDVIKD